jgi:alkanesulfonate monooxygenase SsuD/methylene tetrahydromethanopterin reductase-like flavin-dependent oxidoreductase (luciferase family)
MRVGVGLPAAVPGVDATTIGEWAAEAERAGFASLGVFDRLVYDNLEPLTALAAAAARTEGIELLTTVLTVGWRNNAVLLAKQIASVDLLSGGRLTAGVGLGGWPEDFDAARGDTMTSARQVAGDLKRLAAAGVTDCVLYPCSAEPEQIGLLAEATRPLTSVVGG